MIPMRADDAAEVAAEAVHAATVRVQDPEIAVAGEEEVDRDPEIGAEDAPQGLGRGRERGDANERDGRGNERERGGIERSGGEKKRGGSASGENERDRENERGSASVRGRGNERSGGNKSSVNAKSVRGEIGRNVRGLQELPRPPKLFERTSPQALAARVIPHLPPLLLPKATERPRPRRGRGKWVEGPHALRMPNANAKPLREGHGGRPRAQVAAASAGRRDANRLDPIAKTKATEKLSPGRPRPLARTSLTLPAITDLRGKRQPHDRIAGMTVNQTSLSEELCGVDRYRLPKIHELTRNRGERNQGKRTNRREWKEESAPSQSQRRGVALPRRRRRDQKSLRKRRRNATVPMNRTMPRAAPPPGRKRMTRRR
jgi:hypothetical protein